MTGLLFKFETLKFSLNVGVNSQARLGDTGTLGEEGEGEQEILIKLKKNSSMTCGKMLSNLGWSLV